MTAALLILGALALAWVIYAIRKTETAPLHEDWDVPVPLRSTGPSAEESERPNLPAPIVVHLSVSDRIERSPLTAWERAHAKEMWEAFAESESVKRRNG